jgi:hypothetical protein
MLDEDKGVIRRTDFRSPVEPAIGRAAHHAPVDHFTAHEHMIAKAVLPLQHLVHVRLRHLAARRQQRPAPPERQFLLLRLARPADKDAVCIETPEHLLDAPVIDGLGRGLRLWRGRGKAHLGPLRGLQVLEIAKACAARQNVQEFDMAGLAVFTVIKRTPDGFRQRRNIRHGDGKRSLRHRFILDIVPIKLSVVTVFPTRHAGINLKRSGKTYRGRFST